MTATLTALSNLALAPPPGGYGGSAEKFEEATGRPVKDLSAQIRWFANEKEDIGYKPYIIQVAALQGDQIEFFFISWTNGQAFGCKHSIDLTNRRLAYRNSPSTLPDEAQFFNGFRICFLFLNPDELTGEMATQAGISITNIETGKWPKAAEDLRAKVDELTLSATKLRTAVSQLLALPTTHAALTPDQIREYQNM